MAIIALSVAESTEAEENQFEAIDVDYDLLRTKRSAEPGYGYSRGYRGHGYGGHGYGHGGYSRGHGHGR